jgi:hypothetical protein
LTCNWPSSVIFTTSPSPLLGCFSLSPFCHLQRKFAVLASCAGLGLGLALSFFWAGLRAGDKLSKLDRELPWLLAERLRLRLRTSLLALRTLDTLVRLVRLVKLVSGLSMLLTGLAGEFFALPTSGEDTISTCEFGALCGGVGTTLDLKESFTLSGEFPLRPDLHFSGVTVSTDRAFATSRPLSTSSSPCFRRLGIPPCSINSTAGSSSGWDLFFANFCDFKEKFDDFGCDLI